MTDLVVFGASCVVVGLAAGVLIGLCAPPPRRREALPPLVIHDVTPQPRHLRIVLRGKRGEYVAAADQPAGVGWCEAIVQYNGPARHCHTYARFDRDGRHICGLHRNNAVFGPPRQTLIDAEALGWLEGA